MHQKNIKEELKEFEKNKPKKIKNAFFYYLHEKQDQVKREFPQFSSKVILAEFHQRWKDLSENDKDIYMQMHKKDFENYKIELEKYEKKKNEIIESKIFIKEEDSYSPKKIQKKKRKISKKK